MHLTRADRNAIRYYQTMRHIIRINGKDPDQMPQPLLSCEMKAKFDWQYLKSGRKWANQIIMEATDGTRAGQAKTYQD